MKTRRHWQTKFIAALRVLGNVWVAAKQARIDRTNVYDEYKRNPEFARQWDAAEEESADRLEAEAWRRAHDGVDKPVFHQGEQCGAIREYSDTLLTLLLRARRPAKFRENYSVALGNPDGTKIEFDSRQQAINLFTSSPAAAAHMIALADMMVPEEPEMKKAIPFDPMQDCVGSPILAQAAPVAKEPARKAKKRGRPKKSPPAATVDEFDDSDAQPMGPGSAGKGQLTPDPTMKAKPANPLLAAFLPNKDGEIPY